MFLKSVGNCVPHTPAPLRGFLWRCGGAPQNAERPPRAPNARPHALTRVAEIRGMRGTQFRALLGDVKSILVPTLMRERPGREGRTDSVCRVGAAGCGMETAARQVVQFKQLSSTRVPM